MPTQSWKNQSRKVNYMYMPFKCKRPDQNRIYISRDLNVEGGEGEDKQLMFPVPQSSDWGKANVTQFFTQCSGSTPSRPDFAQLCECADEQPIIKIKYSGSDRLK